MLCITYHWFFLSSPLHNARREGVAELWTLSASHQDGGGCIETDSDAIDVQSLYMLLVPGKAVLVTRGVGSPSPLPKAKFSPLSRAEQLGGEVTPRSKDPPVVAQVTWSPSPGSFPTIRPAIVEPPPRTWAGVVGEL